MLGRRQRRRLGLRLWLLLGAGKRQQRWVGRLERVRDCDCGGCRRPARRQGRRLERGHRALEPLSPLHGHLLHLHLLLLLPRLLMHSARCPWRVCQLQCLRCPRPCRVTTRSGCSGAAAGAAGAAGGGVGPGPGDSGRCSSGRRKRRVAAPPTNLQAERVGGWGGGGLRKSPRRAAAVKNSTTHAEHGGAWRAALVREGVAGTHDVRARQRQGGSRCHDSRGTPAQLVQEDDGSGC